jgi:hypothetical protein
LVEFNAIPALLKSNACTAAKLSSLRFIAS